MKIKILLGIFFSLTMMSLSGCGGGGGGAAPAVPTVISGVASKGQFLNGTVQVFAIDSATGDKKATPLRSVTLDPLAPGVYTADISPYTGPVLIEVSGTFKDEATGLDVTTTTPLRTAIANATGNTTAMVTPLTELAVRNAKKTSGALTAVSINNANTNIATLFKVADITKTKPVDATTAAAATATSAEKDLSLVLATVSQLMKNSVKSLDTVLTDLTTDISVSGTTITMADKSIAGFKTALFDFMGSANNQTGNKDINALPINIGSFKIAHLKISANLPAGAPNIGSIDFTFTLPTGITFTKELNSNQVTPGVVVVSGVAAAAGISKSMALSTFIAQDLRTLLASGDLAAGFGSGEFVDISCTVPPTVTTSVEGLRTAFTSAITSASAPTNTTFVVTDITGAPITGVTLTATVDVF